MEIYNLLLFLESQFEAIKVESSGIIFVLGCALILQVFKNQTVLLEVSLLQLHLYLKNDSFYFDIGANAAPCLRCRRRDSDAACGA